MARSDYSQYFTQGEQKYGLRPGTGSALMSLEDPSGNPYARSPKGARGVLQLMPGTASDMGVSNPTDPAANIDGGLHYFSNILHNQAHGDYHTAAMGYNAGPNRTSFPQSSQSYADQFVSRLPQPPQPQGQPPMPPQMPPMSLGQMAGQPMPQPNMSADAMQPQPQSLGQMADSLPQGNVPQKSHSKFTAGNIMGVLGDALSAYGGKQPTFGPFLREQQMMGQQQSFEREKFQQELAMRMFAYTHPAEFMSAQVLNDMPAPQQYATLHGMDLSAPRYTTVNGSQVLQNRVQTPPPEAIAHLRGAISAGANRASEFAKFDEMFGNGAAEYNLGGQ